jgi:hypothetical protein
VQRSIPQEDAAAIYELTDIYWSVLASVKQALGILGESGMQVTLRYLSDVGIPEEMIPLKFNEFTRRIREIFGIEAVVIEDKIVENIKLRELLSPDTKTLTEAVREIKDRESRKWL